MAEQEIDRWWKESLPTWRKNPAYLAHLERLAASHSREWVREHKREIDGRWDNAVDFSRVSDLVERHGDRWADYF